MKIKYIKSIIPLNLSLLLFSPIVIASNVRTDTTPPKISYNTQQVGDREKLVVTVSATDESGIKEFRDHEGNIISGASTTVEFRKRGNSTFTAIDNYNNESEITINLDWINPYSEGVYNTPIEGSGYWTSSNIREWLNSDSVNVNYTSNPPTNDNMGGKGYDTEPGFLNGFSQEEKNAIAITERRVLVPDMYALGRDGGSGGPPHANNYGGSMLSSYEANVISQYKNYGYRKDLDKVFFLNNSEVYWYMFRRDYSFSKDLTPEAKRKHNTSSKHDWWIQGGSSWKDYEWDFATNGSSLLKIVHPNNLVGVAPCINIKPLYIFENGKKASELKIGEEVQFGQYLNSPITWQVINISDNGYPLLISKNILDLKKFDAKGDYARIYSDCIKFDKADTSMFDNIEYKTTTGSLDVDVPKMRVIDDSALKVRQNNSFTLEFTAEDIGGSGLKYIILPNGKQSNSNSFEYTFTSNKVYIFKLMDNAGNYTEFSLPVGNINQEPVINISSSHPDTWTNEDVAIDIRSSNDVRYNNNKLIVRSNADFGSSEFPNYVGYANRGFRIKGTAKLLDYNEKALDQWFGLGFYYVSTGTNDYGYSLSGHWGNNAIKLNINDLINAENQEISFEIEYLIPSDYSHELKPWGQSSLSPSMGECFSIEMDLTYEIIDDSDFSIKSIILPDGVEVNDVKSYTDIITEEGIHTLKYKVLDNRGKITEKTITVMIDKTDPILNLDYNKTEHISSSISVLVTASDKDSGFKRIQLPDNNYVNAIKITYSVSENGEYTFKAEDVAGNVISKTINITNIDKEVTGISITKTPEFMTNKDVTITLVVNDYSGVKYIIVPNSQKIFDNTVNYTVNSNGTYGFFICDNLNNIKNVHVEVSNIDKKNPIVNISKNPNKEWSNIDIGVTIEATD